MVFEQDQVCLLSVEAAAGDGTGGHGALFFEEDPPALPDAAPRPDPVPQEDQLERGGGAVLVCRVRPGWWQVHQLVQNAVVPFTHLKKQKYYTIKKFIKRVIASQMQKAYANLCLLYVGQNVFMAS